MYTSRLYYIYTGCLELDSKEVQYSYVPNFYTAIAIIELNWIEFITKSEWQLRAELYRVDI
jgi:hypothetical protein